MPTMDIAIIIKIFPAYIIILCYQPEFQSILHSVPPNESSSNKILKFYLERKVSPYYILQQCIQIRFFFFCFFYLYTNACIILFLLQAFLFNFISKRSRYFYASLNSVCLISVFCSWLCRIFCCYCLILYDCN